MMRTGLRIRGKETPQNTINKVGEEGVYQAGRAKSEESGNSYDKIIPVEGERKNTRESSVFLSQSVRRRGGSLSAFSGGGKKT